MIGANSVVTRDIEPGTIAAGAPAKPIRKIEFAGSSSGDPSPEEARRAGRRTAYNRSRMAVTRRAWTG